MCLGLGGGAAAVAVRAQPPAEAAGPPSLTVTVAAVQPVDWAVQLKASGPIAAWHEAVVSARTGGLPLTVLLVDSGSVVRRGDVLARFDDRGAAADVAQARATLDQAIASQRQADTNRDRTLGLQDSGAVSEETVLQAVTQAQTAAAQVAAYKAAWEAARFRLENTVVVAPDAGVIVSRAVSLGQAVANGTELFRMIRQNRLEWRAEVPAEHLAKVAPGQRCDLTLPDGTPVMAVVREVSPALDAGTRLGVVRADLRPGVPARAAMYVQGSIRVGRAAALVVPAESVVIRDGRSYVFVIEDQRARRVTVRTGRRQDDLVEIIEGVSVSQRVAVRGAAFLADGVRLRVAEPARVHTVTGG